MSRPANHRPDRPLASYPDAPRQELPPAGLPGEAEAQPPTPREAPGRPVAELRFLDVGAIRETVPLTYPFELDGLEVHDVTLRRLSVAEVGSLMDGFGPDDPFDIWDFLAVMSGLPAPVLRGLVDDDGAEVLARGRPLLPRSVRLIFGMAETAIERPASGTGAGSP